MIEDNYGKIEIIELDEEPINDLNYILYKLQKKEININIGDKYYIFNKFKLPINSYLIKFSINKQIIFCFTLGLRERYCYCEPGQYSAKFYFKNDRFIFEVLKNDNKRYI